MPCSLCCRHINQFENLFCTNWLTKMVIAMDCSSVAVLILNTDINSGKFRLVVTFLFVLTHVTGTIEKEGVRQGK